jgi:PKD repeat protein
MNQTNLNPNMQTKLKRLFSKLTLLAMLSLPGLASAQSFTYNDYGDVLAGFRKWSPNAGNFELVVNLGSVTNFLNVTAGNTINITNYTLAQLTNAFTDTGGFQDLQWSVFASFPGNSSWVTPVASFPIDTLWFTLPGTNVTTQTTPPQRKSHNTQANQSGLMTTVGDDASYISAQPDVIYNTYLVQEPVAYFASGNGYTLSDLIGDINNFAKGDFGSGGVPLPNGEVAENITPDPFSAAQRDDFYQVCPSDYTDPINNSSTSSYFIGYFILNPNGAMTFTRASAASAPTAGFTGGPTTGFAGFSAMFTNTSTGSITNWVWNFGDGTIITNTTGAVVTHVYATGGDYNVTLTVFGPGGSNGLTQPDFVTTSSLPTFIHAFQSGGKLVLGGTNCPVGVQYRILTSTTLTNNIANWLPVVTNNFLSDGSWTFTNSTANSVVFFRLVSP